MSRLCLVVVPLAASLLAATVSKAEERPPAWEIFVEPENRESATFSLDLDEPETVPPEYTLDELVEPRSTDPDVHIRFTPGRETDGKPMPPERPAPEPRPPSEPPSSFSTPLEPPTSSEPAGPISLESLSAKMPIVRTFEDYRNALQNRTPEILFEGKRWVYSGEEGTYVDPNQLALEEARRTQQNLAYWSAADIGPATGVPDFGIPFDAQAWLEPVPAGTVSPDSPYYPITQDTDRYRVRRAQRRVYGEPGVSPYGRRERAREEIPRNPNDGFLIRRTQRRADYRGEDR